MKIAIEDIREGVSTLEFVCKPEEISLESEGICFLWDKEEAEFKRIGMY